MKRLDAQKFVDELSDAPWDSAFEDTDDIVDSWYKFLLSFLILRYLWKRKTEKKETSQIGSLQKLTKPWRKETNS